jgi:hypothetical protein
MPAKTRPSNATASKTAKKAAVITAKRWSQHITETNNALDLEEGALSWFDPKRIARSFKQTAEASKRRKSSPKPHET